MKIIQYLLLVFIGTFFCEWVGAQTQSAKIDSLVSAYYHAGCFNGVILASRKGGVILRKAYGAADRELDVPMTAEMKFNIASLSKPFTAIIMLQLVDEGRIRLEGKITDYLLDYTGMKGDIITIEHLLTHTSGILQNLDPAKEAVQERLYHSLRDMVRYAEESDLYFEPGTGFHYSNLAYNILACIAEEVTGKPFEKLLKERIFEPLAMADTRQYDASRIEVNRAKGYEYKLLSGYENASIFDPSYTVGPGGLISTADDLSKFDKALYDRKLISKDLYLKMFSPTQHGSYGYGWEVSNKKESNPFNTLRIISHTGSINGFGSYMARIEKDSILIIVLKNNRTDTYISPAYAPVIGQEIIAIMRGEEVRIPKKSIALQLGFIIGQEGINKAIEAYYTIKQSDPEGYNFEESELNQLGIELLFRFNMPEEASRMFEVNMLEFPHSFNTYDSYAYSLKQKGDYVNAIKFYKMGLQIIKEYPQLNDNDSVRKDAENAEKSIKEMEQKTKD